jgi:hypothetical protein
MQRIEHVELIEGEIAKLSLEGNVAWEEIELLVRLSRPDQDLCLDVERILRETEALQVERATILARCWLQVGLRSEDIAKDSVEEPEFREGSVIKAAQGRDQAEGRQIDRPMTLEQALARLKEGT